MKAKALVFFLCVIALIGSGGALSAATISGMVTATRDANRAIVSAVIETSDRDNSGSPVLFNLVMDENGQAITQQYENNEVTIEGSVSGKDITADTWSRVKPGTSPRSSYSEPEPEPEPQEDPDEEVEEDSEGGKNEAPADEEKDSDAEETEETEDSEED